MFYMGGLTTTGEKTEKLLVHERAVRQGSGVWSGVFSPASFIA